MELPAKCEYWVFVGLENGLMVASLETIRTATRGLRSLFGNGMESIYFLDIFSLVIGSSQNSRSKRSQHVRRFKAC